MIDLPERPLTGSFRVVQDLFDEVLRVAPEQEAFVERTLGSDGRGAGRQALTFASWAERADGLAARLYAMGVRRGDVVCLQMPSCIDYAVMYQAVMRLGGVTSGINTRLGPHEVGAILARCRPKLVIRDDTIATMTAIPEGSHRLVGRSELLDTEPGDPQRRWIAAEASDPVAITWTSGTTGLPKGAWFDHTCLYAMSRGAVPLSAVGDRRLSPLPFPHVGAMTRVWDELANLITTIIVPTPWTAATALWLIGHEGVTVGQGVPTQWRMMLDHPDLADTDTSSLRLVSSGSSRIPPELVREVRERFGVPFIIRYASTESCLATGTRLDDPDDVLVNTVGRPNGDVEMRVTGGGRIGAAGEVGSVQLRSRAMMRGYWDDPERTAEAFTPDGWLITGDLGWIGEDANLRLVGRDVEMYIRGGYNVYPTEVENALGDHPNLVASAIVGAPSRVQMLGEIGVAFVVARPGRPAPTLDEVRAFVKSRLASYKAPDCLVAVDQLPVTNMGKIDKRALKPDAERVAATWRRDG